MNNLGILMLGIFVTAITGTGSYLIGLQADAARDLRAREQEPPIESETPQEE